MKWKEVVAGKYGWHLAFPSFPLVSVGPNVELSFLNLELNPNVELSKPSVYSLCSGSGAFRGGDLKPYSEPKQQCKSVLPFGWDGIGRGQREADHAQ